MARWNGINPTSESEASMSTSSAKERIHQLIDQVSDEEAEELELVIKLALISEDDEPETEEERRAVEESKAAYRRGEVITAGD
jgi:hypothetical protein